jgi:O-succinylbenzoic acid--CoA ligase
MTCIAVLRASVEPYTLTLSRVLRTAQGDVRFRRGYLVRVEDTDGRAGWGDAACFPGFGSNDTAVGARLAELAPTLKGTIFDSVDAIDGWLSRSSIEPEARAALELALLDLVAQARGQRIAELLDVNHGTSAASHVLVAALDERLRTIEADTFKLKVGRRLDEDTARVAELRRLLGPNARIRLDAGGGYAESVAAEALRRFAAYGIELLEQPIAPGDLEAMARLRGLARQVGIKLAADEDVYDEASLARVIQTRAADVVVLKPMFLGGLVPARRLALRALDAGLDVIVTHALESAVGRTGALHLAATLPGVHGLAWETDDDLAAAPTLRRGRLALPSNPGLGIAPNRAASNAIPHPVASSALAHPDRHAARFEGATLTYRDLAARVATVASVLKRNGVRPGDRVALLGAPSLDFLVAFHAIGWADAIACPVPERATPEEREVLLAAFGAAHRLDAAALPPCEADATALPEPWWTLDSVRAVIATSGSTGAPKLVPIRTSQLVFGAFGSAMRLGHLPNDGWLCPLPLHHIGGLSVVMRCAFAATTAILHGRFDAAAVAAELDSGSVSLASLTPTMLERVLDVRGDGPMPNRVRALLLGGGPSSETLLERCRKAPLPVALTWGMTEAASQLATREPGDLRSLDDGIPMLPFARAFTEGERLIVRGPSVGGTLVTADRGHATSGRVVIAGRADDAIVHGGENIDPREVERALLTHPAVSDAAVFGVPSERYGEDVAAVLVSVGPRPTLEALRAHARALIAAFKLPTRLVWTETLPRTAMGKLDGSSLRRLLDQTQSPESLEEAHRGSRSGHVGHAHEDVNKLGPGAHILRGVGTGERVSEHDRAAAHALDAKRDIDAFVQPNRLHEVRLGVDERHTDALLGDQTIDAHPCGEEQLLVGRVAHLEDATEEHDSSAIHLVEARSDAMNERHNHE